MSEAKSAKEEAAAVTQAYLRCIEGYEITEVQSEYKVNDQGELELTRETRKTKQVPADPRAAEFWLANRRPKRWKYPRFLAPKEKAAKETGGVVEISAVEDTGDGT